MNYKNESDILRKKKMLGTAAGFGWSFARLIFLAGISYLIFYPIIFCISISIRQPNDMLDPSVVWLPKNLTLDNFKFIFTKTDFVPAFWRTSGMTLLCSVLQTIICAITGYGFARFKFKGRNLLFICALLTFIVPPQIISMPLYIQYANITNITAQLFGGEGIQIINTITPIAVSALVGQGLKAGLFIYLYRQSYKSMPRELEDAAYLDGCGPIRAFTDIMLVNSAPIMLVTFLLSFVWYWNDYISTSLFFNKSQPLSSMLMRLPSVLMATQKENGFAYNEIERSVYTMTGCLIFIAVPIIIYTILQKKFTESLMSTSIVG